MKFLSVVLLLLTSVSAWAALPPAVVKAKKATHQIFQSVLLGGDACSATAIGPYALITATHCELPSEEVSVEGFNKSAHIEGRIRDGADHTIYLLSGVKFDDYIDVDLSDKLEQGEDVYVWGNPGAWSDQVRKGYITGREKLRTGIFSSIEVILVDWPTFHGDSGAGILSEQGKLIGVNSLHRVQAIEDDPNDSIRLGGFLALKFKQSDIDDARNFKPKS